jgi:hypothetical protein
MRNVFSKAIVALSFIVAAISAQAQITTEEFSFNQVFDVQWYISGSTLNVSGFNYLYASQPTNARLTSAQVASYVSAGDYLQFFNSTTNPGTYGLAVYNNGTQVRVIDNTGTFSALANGAIFYNGVGMWGTLFTTGQGYSLGGSASFTNVIQNPSSAQLANYVPATTLPLAAGQTAAQANSSNNTPPAPAPAPTVTGTTTTTTATTATNTGATTTVTAVVNGAPAVSAVVTYSKQQAATTINIDKNTVTTTVIPVTTTVTATTPITTTTTTIPTTVTTYSDNSTTTSVGAATVTTSTTNQVVTTTSQTVTASSATTDQMYSTRIDMYAQMRQQSDDINHAVNSDPFTRTTINNGKITMRNGTDTDVYVNDMMMKTGTNGYNTTAHIQGVGMERLESPTLLLGWQYNHADNNMALGDNTASGNFVKDMIDIYAVKSIDNWLLKFDYGASVNNYTATHTLSELNLINSGTYKGTEEWFGARVYTPDYYGIRLFAGDRATYTNTGAVNESGSALSSASFAANRNVAYVGEGGVAVNTPISKNWAINEEISRDSKDVVRASASLSYKTTTNSSVLIKAIGQAQRVDAQWQHSNFAQAEFRLNF